MLREGVEGSESELHMKRDGGKRGKRESRSSLDEMAVKGIKESGCVERIESSATVRKVAG